MTETKRSIIYCSVPRSGSTLLCTYMNQLKVFGEAHEYFDPGVAARKFYPEISDKPEEYNYNDDPLGYLKAITEKRTTEGGFFSTKMHHYHYQNFSKLGVDLFKELPNPVFIYITRGDVLKQAISWAKATQTKAFVYSDTPVQEPVYSFKRINDALSFITSGEQFWENYFQENGIYPLRLCYETLVKNRIDTLRSVINHIGFNVPDQVLMSLNEHLRPQTDQTNIEWLARYNFEVARLTHAQSKEESA